MVVMEASKSNAREQCQHSRFPRTADGWPMFNYWPI